MYVNCWHINNRESAAMWKIYLKSDEGIAIASTVQSLTKCFKNPEPVYVGSVPYLDYKDDVIEPGNFFRSFMRKRKVFEYERELRALVWDGDRYTALLKDGKTTADKPDWDPAIAFEPGRDIAVDLDTLVEEIFVAPTAPKWFHGLVDATLKTYRLAKPVKPSSLLDDPVW